MKFEPNGFGICNVQNCRAPHSVSRSKVENPDGTTWNLCTGHAAQFDADRMMRVGDLDPNVGKPSKTSNHYQSNMAMEAIDVVEAFDLGRNLANVCKYILRADRKGVRERDLEKAIDFLWRERYGTWFPRPDKGK